MHSFCFNDLSFAKHYAFFIFDFWHNPSNFAPKSQFKMTRIFLLLFVFMASWNIAPSFGQSLLEKKLVLEKTSGTIAELLEEIADQGGFEFSYNSSHIPLSDTVVLNNTKQSVSRLLENIFKGKDIEFIEQTYHIILRRKREISPIRLNGYVLTKGAGEPVPGANVFIPSLSIGTISDAKGHFELTFNPGDYRFQISHVSYQTNRKNHIVLKDTTLIFYVSERSFDLPGLTISDRRLGEYIDEVEISKHELTIQEIKAMPAMFGEVDILRSLQFLPGIHTGGDINAGVFVRGGSSDQSLIQLNGVTLYNPMHFGGLFSVFNPEIIKEVEIHKGNIPVRMGGRLSSVFNNHLKTGSKQEFKGAGGIGLISSRLTVEGPIVKDKASFILSGRRTYFDLFTRLTSDEDLSNTNFFFYDLNGSFDVNVNASNRLVLSLYKGSDVFKVQDIIGMDWGNFVGSINWDRIVSDKLFMNTNIGYTDYGYSFLADVEDEMEMVWTSNIREVNLKMDADYVHSDKVDFNLGYQAIGRYFTPTYLKVVDNSASSGAVSLDDKLTLEQALYVGLEQQVSEKLSLQYGLRYSMLQNIGPGKVLVYGDESDKVLEEVIDTLYYDRGEIINTYHGPEPRFVARYFLDEHSALKVGYSRTRQYIQVASTATAGNPTDRWIPADTYIKPQVADLFSAGYFRNFMDGKIETSVELYYGLMHNQIDFKEAVIVLDNMQFGESNILLNNYLETRLLSGKAKTYGAEFLFKKNNGRLTGWMSYTYSKVRRQINGINSGKPYSPRYDQPHNITLTANYTVSPKISVGANWVYNTGNAVTYPKGKYFFEGKEVPYYAPEERNHDRLPAYHRLDLSLTFTPKPSKPKRWHGSWNVSLYNAYYRKNPVVIQFREVINGDPSLSVDEAEEIIKKEFKPVKIYFPIMPSLTYNFYF